MSKEMIAALADRLAADADLRSAVSAAVDPAGLAEVLSAAGFPVTMADVALAEPGALSDWELEAAAGGVLDPGIGATDVVVWTRCF